MLHCFRRGNMAALLTVTSSLILMTCVAGNMMNRTIVVTTVLDSPYVFLKDSGSGSGGPTYAGFVVDILERLSRNVGFDYSLQVLKNGDYGYEQPDGTWVGMIGQLTKNKADMAAGPLTVSLQRSHVVDFALPFQVTSRVAIVKRYPRPSPSFLDDLGLGARLGKLLTPLEDSVWLLSGLAWFVTSLVLYVVCRLNPYDWRRMMRDQEATRREGESFSCVNAYWFTIGAVFWQGFMRAPRSMGGRVVVAFWWAYSLIFVSMYIASLTNLLRTDGHSHLAPPTHPHDIKSFEDIADYDNMTVGVLKDGATMDFFKHSTIPTYKKVWAKVEVSNSQENNYAIGLTRVRDSTLDKPYVYLAESELAQSLSRQPPCDLYVIKVPYYPIYYSFAFPKGSDLKTKVDKAMLRMKESGFMMVLQHRWFAGSCNLDVIGQNLPVFDNNTMAFSTFRKVDMASFSGALILLLLGLFVGSLVTVCEVLLFRYTEKDSPERLRHHRQMAHHNDLDNHGVTRDLKPITDV